MKTSLLKLDVQTRDRKILYISVQGAFNTLAEALSDAMKSKEVGQLDEEV